MGGESNEAEMGFKHGDLFFSSVDWDPVVNGGVFSSSHYSSMATGMSCFPHYPSGSSSVYADLSASSSLLPFVDCGGGGDHISRFLGSDKNGESVGRLIRACDQSHVDDHGVLGASPIRKRKQPEAESQRNKKAVEEEVQESHKRYKDDQSKETMNKESSQSEEAPKQNYIHMRARRGQATNSHSLAERVRREKISERMRLLQELVPGCNKITGKAVMLDEIINYVQSLQQQVEFLSMRLATLNPELNIDIDKILAKDVRDRNTSSLNPFNDFQGMLSNISTTRNQQQYNLLPQTTLESELQSFYQMGFVSNPSNFSPNGRLKPEL